MKAKVTEAARVSREKLVVSWDELGAPSDDDDDGGYDNTVVGKKRKRDAAPGLPEQVKLALRFTACGTSLRDTAKYMKYFNAAIERLTTEVSYFFALRKALLKLFRTTPRRYESSKIRANLEFG